MLKNYQVSRRGLLSAGAASALPLPGCSRLSPEIPGELRGASMSLGHALRGATLEQAPAGAPARVGVVIVGGGPSGLSAAWRLERLGFRDYLVLELESRAGGTSTFGSDGVVPHPWGAHYVPVPTADNAGLVSLLDEMDMLERGPNGAIQGKERWLVREPESRIFAGGAWHEGLFPTALATPEDLAELRRFEAEMARWVAFRDTRGRRAFALPMWSSSDDAELTELDKVSAASWLQRRGFRSPLLRWYVEYACRDDYGASLEVVSAWAMLFYFCSRTSDTEAGSASFLSWPEGNGRVVQHLAGVVGDRLRTGSLVTDVLPNETSVELAVLDARTGKLTRLLADAVVLATPSFVNARVLRPWRARRPAFLDDFRVAAWWVANVHLKERPKSKGFPFAWDNVLFDSPSVGYVAATHQALRDRGPSVWTYYRPLWEEDAKLARQQLMALDQRSAAAEVLDDLGRAHKDFRASVERIDVWRWGHAMITPTPGCIFGSSRRQAQAPVGRVHFAHSDLSGIPLLEEAQARGVAAAEAVLRSLGREVSSLFGPGT